MPVSIQHFLIAALVLLHLSNSLFVESVQCNVESPVHISYGKSRTFQGCESALKSSDIIHSSVKCNDDEQCLFSSYMAMGDECGESYPKLQKGFVGQSLCASAQQDNFQCEKDVLVPVGFNSTQKQALCLIVSCFDNQGCDVTATISVSELKTSFARVGDGDAQTDGDHSEKSGFAKLVSSPVSFISRLCF